MSWFRKRRPGAAEALEFERAGIATDSPAAEFLPVVEALRRTANSLPPPTKLQARRAELVAVGTAPPAARRVRRRIVRPVLLAAIVAILLAAAALGAAVVTSWLKADLGSAGHAPLVFAPTGRSQDVASPSGVETQPGLKSGMDGLDSSRSWPPVVDAERRSALHGHCGERQLGVECEAAPESALPTASPVSTVDELAAELLAVLVAACDEDATLPDLAGVDDATATALVEALAAECEAALTLP